MQRPLKVHCDLIIEIYVPEQWQFNGFSCLSACGLHKDSTEPYGEPGSSQEASFFADRPERGPSTEQGGEMQGNIFVLGKVN